MRKLLVFFAFYLISVFSTAQVIIEHPRYGLGNVNYLSISQIELTEASTVLEFNAKPPQGGWIAIDENSYIQVVGDTTKLMLQRVEGVEFGRQYPGAEFPELSYRLFFPPIDKSVTRIDFGELVSSNPWKIYDIEIRRLPGQSPVPDELLGNWFNTSDGKWEISFYDSVAVYNATNWHYKSVERNNNSLEITLESSSESVVIYAIKSLNGSWRIGVVPGNLAECSPGIPASGIRVNPDVPFDEQIFKPGLAVYRGFIRGFTSRFGTSTGTITSPNNLTSEMETHLIEIAPDGTFEVSIPLDYPKFINVRLPSGNESVFLEPGEILYQLINSGLQDQPSLFAGGSGNINSGFRRTSVQKLGQMDVANTSLNMDVSQYMSFLNENRLKEKAALDELKHRQAINVRSWQLQMMELDVRTAQYAIMYNNLRYLASIYRNMNLPEKEQIAVDVVCYNPEDLVFINGFQINSPQMMMVGEYINLLNTLKNFSFERPMGPFYVALVMTGEKLVKSGIKLTGEESDMLEFIRTNLAENHNPKAARNLSQSYGEVMRGFQTKYSKDLNAMMNTFYEENLKHNLQRIFNVSDGFAFDVVNTQNYLRSLKNADPSEAEFRNVREKVGNIFLKEKVIEGYYARKSEIDAARSTSEYVPVTEADKRFDNLVKKYRGKLVYVDFWATWCGPCRDGIEKIKPLKAELADNKDIVFLYISNHTSPEKDYLQMIPGIDGEHVKVSQDEWNYLVQKFNIFGIPHYALIDRRGRVVMNNMRLENGPLKKLLMDNL
jgi:thiol-disulfide isomerase/thioredoxin